MKKMDSRRKPVKNLGETLNSLLGLKTHLTSSWIKSVFDIATNLPSSSHSTPTILHTNHESGNDISKIKEELSGLTAYINQLNIQRRQVLNDFLDLKGNIRVFCRIRPIRTGENSGSLKPVVASDSSNVLLKIANNKSKSYRFDKVFHPDSSQDEVFSEVEPVIKSVVDGYNACILAYGQTGTGKTHSMEGTPDSPGIVPRAIEALIKQATDSNHAFLINFSMLEIYLGNLRDLLVTQPTKPTDPLPPW
ncbi:kinesin-like protein KIN-14T isoform X2 [Carica papaya]|nr:kinesin-like protein KIN-14T isoform X2 [Carica papaya]